jgi:hypothetical protein
MELSLGGNVSRLSTRLVEGSRNGNDCLHQQNVSNRKREDLGVCLKNGFNRVLSHPRVYHSDVKIKFERFREPQRNKCTSETSTKGMRGILRKK